MHKIVVSALLRESAWLLAVVVYGADIRAALDGVANLPANFEQLWLAHAASDRAANVQRLVAATQAMHAAAAAANPGSKKPKTVR